VAEKSLRRPSKRFDNPFDNYNKFWALLNTLMALILNPTNTPIGMGIYSFFGSY